METFPSLFEPSYDKKLHGKSEHKVKISHYMEIFIFVLTLPPVIFKKTRCKKWGKKCRIYHVKITRCKKWGKKYRNYHVKNSWFFPHFLNQVSKKIQKYTWYHLTFVVYIREVSVIWDSTRIYMYICVYIYDAWNTHDICLICDRWFLYAYALHWVVRVRIKSCLLLPCDTYIAMIYVICIWYMYLYMRVSFVLREQLIF